ncbi:MAG: dicarboxylate/amino acid:cation symporter [Oligoflexia bacterium]|nr:dicarboxylate/amino acid:cation symporter [Oligoflexia bacterium]
MKKIFEKTHALLFFALVGGALLGGVLHSQQDNQILQFVTTNVFATVGQVFLRLIFMIVVPMIFSAIVIGACELGQSQGLGAVTRRTVWFTFIFSSISVIVGIVLVNVLRPGHGIQISEELIKAQSGALSAIQTNAQNAKSGLQAIIDLIPKNPLESAVNALSGDLPALMVFALFFGIGLSAFMTRQEKKHPTVLQFLEQVYGTCMIIVEYAMKLAPFAVFGLVFNTAFRLGFGIFTTLLFYVLVVVLGLLIQQFLVFGTALRIYGISPFEFFSKSREVYLYAFSTASSNATLPQSLKVAETKLGIPARVARFVLTVGSTANQNGTALFEGVTVLFLAQVYGVDLSLSQQFQVVLMSILAGIGTAGVPGGSLPLILILIKTLGIPAEGMALILGVDRFLDMCRTTLNVSGDLVIAALVGKGSKN